MVFERKEARRCALFQKSAIARQVAVVGRVDGVQTRVVAEFERKERRRTPRDVGIDVDLVAGITQVRKATAAHRTKIHLRTGSQMNEPVNDDIKKQKQNNNQIKRCTPRTSYSLQSDNRRDERHFNLCSLFLLKEKTFNGNFQSKEKKIETEAKFL